MNLKEIAATCGLGLDDTEAKDLRDIYAQVLLLSVFGI